MIEEPSGHSLAGAYALEVLGKMQPAPDDAAEFHRTVETALKSAGFTVRREARVGIRESGRGAGRIDLLASIHDGFVAIELDRRSPRSKSLDKLRSFNAFRIVIYAWRSSVDRGTRDRRNHICSGDAMIAEVVRKMAAAGAPSEAIAIAVEAIEQAQAQSKVRREKNAARMRTVCAQCSHSASTVQAQPLPQVPPEVPLREISNPSYPPPPPSRPRFARAAREAAASRPIGYRARKTWPSPSRF